MSGIASMTESLPECRIILAEPMSRHTSWRTGGSADRYAIPETIDELSQLIRSLPEDESIEWMGLGSNTLVRDGGYRGTIVATQNVLNELELLDQHKVYAGAGVADAKLARFCARHGLVGAEFFAGIPGLVGGALAMNAGAWGGETWQHVISVETMNRKGEIRQRNKAEFEIGYRHIGGLDGEWFTGATFQFDKKTVETNNSQAIDIKKLLAKRAASQPTGVASCGSVFTNPEHDFAARLIESCGLKGKRIGGAVVSEKHANFIINDQQATAGDIEQLIAFIQQTVEQKHGIRLQTEVRIIGEESR